MRHGYLLTACCVTIGATHLVLSAGVASGATLLNDTFADNDRTNQALPGSAQWFIASSHGFTRDNFNAAAGALSLPQSEGGTAASEIAYFAPSGTPQSLAVGDSLSVTFDLKIDALASSSRGFRLGVFDSTGSRLTADSTNQATPATDISQGYTFDINPVGFASQLTERRGTGNVNSIIFGGTQSSLGTGTASGGSAITAGTPFEVALTLSRTASGISLSGSFNGNTFAATDNNAGGDGAIFTAFDTLAFFQTSTVVNGGGFAASPSTITFDDVVVTYTPVPEPAAIGLLAAGVLAILARRSGGGA